MDSKNIRNIAIIAHVDHGKTTLVDGLLKQSKVFRDNEAEMTQTTIMDSNTLERERGITILSKNTAIHWDKYKINILDTPGHADFSGEVERVLNMADGCLLVVDAAEGVMSQTRYVLKLAMKAKLRPIVVINKIDKKDARPYEVIEEVNDLFLELANTDDQLNFTILYAIGRQGLASHGITAENDGTWSLTDAKDLGPLFETIIAKIPHPEGTAEGGFQMQVTSLDRDDYKGKYVIGRIMRGIVKKNDVLAVLRPDETVLNRKVEYLFTYDGLHKVEIEESSIGDIVALTGFADSHIGDTLTSLDNKEALPPLPIEEPTLKMTFAVNTSPFAGKEGKFSTSRQLRERLYKELETNVGLRVEDAATTESFIVSGRGELHLSILIETMRREGYEFSVSRPEVIFKTEGGHTTEPWELLTIDVPEDYMGVVTTEMGQRRAQMINMHTDDRGEVRFDYKIATRHLIGFRNLFLTQTSGRGIMNSLFLGYEKKGEDVTFNRNGALIASEGGPSSIYGLANAQERGVTFIPPQIQVYEGMVIGMNSKKDDMPINICKEKKLTNMRASSADIAVKLTPALNMSLEQCMDFLGPDELLEVTPISLRLRKRHLNEVDRRRASRN
ncbi:MAG: translational GTPase TypA [bacterium]|nr:translational GTPase TypA [bacterium]